MTAEAITRSRVVQRKLQEKKKLEEQLQKVTYKTATHAAREKQNHFAG